MSAQFVRKQLLLKQLLLEPERHRHPERAEAARREGQIGFEQALEFQERLVVERNLIDLVETDAGLFEAVVNGAMRESRVVLLAREALFLGGRNDLAIAHERRGAVVVERGDAERDHAVLALGAIRIRR